MPRWLGSAGLVLSLWTVAAGAQTPQPFPRAGEPRPQTAPARPVSPSPTATAPSQPAGQLAPAVAPAAPAGTADPAAPPPEDVVFPVYPSAQFLSAYDAG